MAKPGRMTLSAWRICVPLAMRIPKVRANFVTETVRRLRQIAAPLLGVVLNEYTQGGSGYGYGYGYNRIAPKATQVGAK